MTERVRTVLAMLSMLAVAGSTGLAARETRGSGEGAYVTMHEESSELPGGRTLRHYRTAGFVTSDPASPFHRTEQDCSGTEVSGAGNESVSDAGYCVGTDPEGDVWWIWFRGDDEGGIWGLLGGTGKFEKLKGGGSLRYVHRWPSGKYTIKWEGTWESGD
jgi:hypothetical protein